MLTAANVTTCSVAPTARLDLLMGRSVPSPEQVFHYAPFCFAASWILLLTCSFAQQRSHAFHGSQQALRRIETCARRIFPECPRAARTRSRENPGNGQRARRPGGRDFLARAASLSFAATTAAARVRRLFLARPGESLMFPAIRKSIGPNLKALICGSAPLSLETQLFFMMIGIPVLQVYGLTETTAICTMDDPRSVEPGRVGPAIPGIEMTRAENGEILVRGPNIFPDIGSVQRKPRRRSRVDGSIPAIRAT